MHARRLKNGSFSILLSYTDGIVIFGESKTVLEETVIELTVLRKNMVLKINENKTIHMLMGRRTAPFQNLNVYQFFFEPIKNFKYLSANINHKNNT